MKSTSEIAQPDGLAFLCDHQGEFPYWLRGLAHGELVDSANLRTGWHSESGGHGIVPSEEVDNEKSFALLLSAVVML